jgi:hypothetical protein
MGRQTSVAERLTPCLQRNGLGREIECAASSRWPDTGRSQVCKQVGDHSAAHDKHRPGPRYEWVGGVTPTRHHYQLTRQLLP